MTAWVAVAFGALNVVVTSPDKGDEIVVCPVLPSEPRALIGAGRTVWSRLVADGPVAEEDFSAEELAIVREMEAAGLASRQSDDVAHCRSIPRPWLTSPFHELVYALIASVARDLGIRCVFIKGPVLHAQGLRDREHSGDVDVWVEPSRFEDLLAAMEPWGWVRQPDLWADTDINHSRTLIPTQDWACEIDVHRRLPGIGVSDASAFSALFETAESGTFAGVAAKVPNRNMSAALAALHAMRPEIGIGTRPGGEEQATALLQLVGAEALTSVAQLGAQSALRIPLQRTFAPAQLAHLAEIPPRDWVWRQQSDRAHGYIVALRSLPYRQRIAMIWRVLWPKRDLVRLSDANAGGHAKSILVARWRRLRRGISGSH